MKLIPLYRIIPFLVLNVWLTACAGQFPVSDISAQGHPQSWARVEIAKPTYTPSPTLAPTFTPSPTEVASPTLTPGMIYAEIVPDTPTPEYASQAYTQQQPAPAVPSYGGNKYILISISEQHLYAYEGDTLVYSFVASTGMNNATRAGMFSVLDKIPNAYGATWNIWMPNWLGIYWAGSMENGIHALPILPNGAQLWAGFLGRPISYGCIVLGAYEAQLLYDWADIGTPVEIRW
jgi:lipoprotein-anchoring transpeptidase ErfK/SrfK